MGQLLIGRHGAGEFENPYNFPLTISMTEPAPKTIGHIWVKSDAGAQITNVVIDDAFRESYPDGTLLLKESAKDEDYTLTCTKKDASGVKRSFSYSRPCTDNILNWTVGSLNKNDTLYTVKHLYPLIYTKLNGAIDIENAYVWTGNAWDVLCQSGSLLAVGQYSHTTINSSLKYTSAIRLVSIAEDNFIYTAEAQIPFPGRYVRDCSFTSDGKYLILQKPVVDGDNDTMPAGLYAYKREGLTFTRIANFFDEVFNLSIAIEFSNTTGAGWLFSISHDGKKIAFAPPVKTSSNVPYFIVGDIVNDVVTNIRYLNSYTYFSFCVPIRNTMCWSYDDKYIAIYMKNSSGGSHLTGVISINSSALALDMATTSEWPCSYSYFLGDTYDIVAHANSNPYFGILRYNPSARSFINLPITLDTTQAALTALAGDLRPNISSDGKYLVVGNYGGTTQAQQGLLKFTKTKSGYTVKPLYSFLEYYVNGTKVLPNNRYLFFCDSTARAFHIDPTTDTVSEDTATADKFRTDSLTYGAEYNGLTYFNWNGVTK